LGEAEDGLQRSRIALALAETLSDESLIGEALGLMGACELLLGRPGASLVLKRVLKLHRRLGTRCAFCHLGRLWAHSLTGYNDHEPVRRELLSRHRHCVERGEASFLPGLLLSMSQLECWGGEWDQAVTRADEGLRQAAGTGQHTYSGALLASAALAMAHLGNGDRTRALATAGLKSAQESGDLLAEVANGFALGFLELSHQNPGAADAWLRPGLERLYNAGIREPAILRFLPDQVETLVMLGNLKEARTQLGRWRDLPRRPWVDALARRCQGLLLAAAGKGSAGLAELQRAAEESFALPPFERARTLLMLGVVLRRCKQKASALHLLDQAIAIFDELRAAIWAKRARMERARLGFEARPGELTATEERVAELAARGLSNQQIAASLFISPRTVEVNLTRIFHKLDIKGGPGRRRIQLESRLLRVQQRIA
jgi:DNA-binding CsgD family transcriptional regulator